jgi:peptidyl-tRNA hydrolase
MSDGKAHAQSGHAYTDTLLHALQHEDPRALAYAALRPGTKVCLNGGSHADMLRLLDRLGATPLPHVRIIDSGHVEPPDFYGRPVLTAIGVGPLLRADAPPFLKRLPLWTGPFPGRQNAHAPANPNPQREHQDGDKR